MSEMLLVHLLQVCRGIQETERMLLVGTGMLGIGEIFLQDGRIKLGPCGGPNIHDDHTPISIDEADLQSPF